MNRARIYTSEDQPNPYIALADLAINLVLVLAFFVAAVAALGRAGWEQVRYRDAQAEFRRAVQSRLPNDVRPWENPGKHDPPGVQRWVFPGNALFRPDSTELRPAARVALAKFAELLAQHRSQWRRIRIEGHTAPPSPGAPDDWELSAARGAVVARIIEDVGRIQPYYLAVSSRAGQDPFLKILLNVRPGDPKAASIKRLLKAEHVTFSEKRITEAESLPLLFANGREIREIDSAEIKKLISDFRANSRVEVLVEYSDRPAES